MGKTLCFLSVVSRAEKSTYAGGGAQDTVWARKKLDDAPEELQLLLEPARWEGAATFDEETGMLRPEAEARFTGLLGRTDRSGEPLVYVTDAEMLRAKPHPVFIGGILERLAAGTMSVARAAACLEMSEAQVVGLAALPDKVQRSVTAKIARVMQGRRAQVCRSRPARIAHDVLEALARGEALRAAWPIVLLAGDEEASIPVPVVVPKLQSDDEQQRRDAYAHGKKAPQIAWMLQRLRELTGSVPKPEWMREAGWVGGETATESDSGEEGSGSSACGDFWAAVDVGGGRGDLALNIAGDGRLPRVRRVHLLEIHRPSLDAARAAAAQLAPAVCSKLALEEAGVESLAAALPRGPGGAPLSPRRTILVGLHACGGLTDAVLACARRHASPFLVCACCFLKHPHLRQGCFADDRITSGDDGAGEGVEDGDGGTVFAESEWVRLRRMADLSDPHDQTVEIQREAMHSVAAMRLARFPPHAWRLRLLAFPREWSPRNLVVVGEPR